MLMLYHSETTVSPVSDAISCRPVRGDCRKYGKGYVTTSKGSLRLLGHADLQLGVESENLLASFGEGLIYRLFMTLRFFF